jgi:superfamily I DNA/RNA helicase
MSIWWVQKSQLDPNQINLIENLPLRESFLILGPPGSGKTNILVRRAQFIRSQGMANVLVLTFTRALTEFVKTGCFDAQGREIFPESCVSTLESWIRELYESHGRDLPRSANLTLSEWKRNLALGAQGLASTGVLPRYEALFIDEAQDLLPEEIQLLSEWTPVLFFVGDDRQRIYEDRDGLEAVRRLVGTSQERELQFHYRIAPEICHMADRIMLPVSGQGLATTAQYKGPRPAVISIQREPLSKDRQIDIALEKLAEQIRVYGDLIRQGDRLGVIVARKEDRETVFDAFEADSRLNGKSKIIRARGENESGYDPSFDPDTPVCILTIQGSKGLEFRAVHWLFADDLDIYHRPEHFYTVVTRAKTSLDISFTSFLPRELAKAYAPPTPPQW